MVDKLSPKVKNQNLRGPGKAEAEVAVPKARGVPAANRRAATVSEVVPTTAAEHPKRAFFCIYGYGVVSLGVAIGPLAIYILAPLRYIAAHVVYTQPVGSLRTHRVCGSTAVSIIPPHSIHIASACILL